jgi:type I restriction enzyme, S subunit
MAVREGYKKTHIGLIPYDWEVEQLGNLIDFQGGSQPPLTTFIHTQKYGYIRLLQIRDYKTDKYETYIPIYLARKFCAKGDIMIGRYGPPIFQILRGLVGAYNVALMKAVPSKQVDKEYIFHFLKQDVLLDFVEKLSQRSSGQTGVDLQQLKGYSIGLPPKSEQIIIATALSDTDALIENLERLIVKKRNIKQGAMQNLLSGKKCLAGYDGNWELKKLGDIAEIKTGKKNNDDKIVEGLFPFFVRSQTVERINSYSFEGEAILIPGEGNIGRIYHYINGKFDYHQRVYKISNFNEAYCGKFIYFKMLQRFNVYAMKHTVKATVDSLRLPTFQEFEMNFPPLKDEQETIANILTDMDTEIEALEQKLSKYRMIKHGMMQVLLTGKIRLI